MATLARWCFRHRWLVLLIWLLAFAGVAVGGNAAGDRYDNSMKYPGADSSRALDLMAQAFPRQSGDADTVVWHVTRGSVRDADVRAEMTAALADVAKVPTVGAVRGPYDAAGAGQISEDGRTAYASVTFTKQAGDLDQKNVQRVLDLAQEPAGGRLEVELGGSAVAKLNRPPAHVSEVVGVTAAAVVLFLAFGSLFAMLLPIVTALFSVGLGVTGVALVSHATSIAETAPMLATLIGLGVGIDYALFIVTRHRTGIRRGLAPEEAAVQAINTSGRAVLFAGGTVCISILGMLTFRLSFLNGLAVAVAMAVLLTMAAAITLLPAMLGVLGSRVLGRRERRRLAERGPDPERASGGLARWSSFLERHPRELAGAALAVILVIAIPVFSLRLGSNDQGNDPASTTTRKAYDLLADGFGPGFNGPLQLVAEVPGAADRAALDALASEVTNTPGVARVTVLPAPPNAGIGVVQVVPTTSPQDQKTDQLIDRLRDEAIPRAERGTTMQVHVGGITAISKDFASLVGQRLPLFLTSIVGLSFLLLLVAFRSLVVPLTAALMNLLAAAASFGFLVAAFQWGWLVNLLDLGKPGPIQSFLPVLMISMLFGLSMDYQVFLVSRMHEEWVHSRDNRRAVRVGLTETGRVINSAAVIMICVFSAFVLSGNVVAMMAGIGFAGAVAMDAFILRTVLVPSVMHLVGRANWWLPRWLERHLPHLAIEPPEQPGTAGDPAPAPTAKQLEGAARD